MKIDKDKYYAIVRLENGKVISYFNSRIYSGRFVMSAYNQMQNKESYTICQIKPKVIEEK